MSLRKRRRRRKADGQVTGGDEVSHAGGGEGEGCEGGRGGPGRVLEEQNRLREQTSRAKLIHNLKD